MVGNFREGFIFVFFVSQEPFVKIKTAKILSSTCKQMTIPDLLGTIYIAANRTVSASVPLTAIAEAIQEIEILHSTDAQTRQRRKAESGSNLYYEHPGYKRTFLAVLEQRAEIAISFCKQF